MVDLVNEGVRPELKLLFLVLRFGFLFFKFGWIWMNEIEMNRKYSECVL